MGCLYKRGNVWWLKYAKNGRPFRESSHSKLKMVAKKLLDLREGEIAQGRMPGVIFESVTYFELREELIQDYRINERKSADRAHYSLKHLDQEFGGERVVNITTPRVKSYTVRRLDQGAANATINRELAALKRMLKLGFQQTPSKVGIIPYIPMLKERNVRKGFFEHGDFLALLAELPPYLRGMISFAYKSGWRKTEILTLTWSQVDRDQWIVRLEPGDSKNEEARTIYLDKELVEIFQTQWAERKRSKIITPFVFTNGKGTDQIKDFYGVWRRACARVGIGNRNFHDFRRTAIRNMVRAGVSERVAMTLSGHKTRAVFDRYNIVNDSDLRDAANKMADYQKNVLGTVLGTVRRFDEKRGLAPLKLTP